MQKVLPELKVTYNVDPLLQAIADGWPMVLEDIAARRDWGLEARVRPLRAGADHADSHHYLQPSVHKQTEPFSLHGKLYLKVLNTED
ncbi:hypothetical protein KUCAC02_032738 [Chaenocephalus aceratus]|nr:hypothetical protein KUCAC02_032738 [Chaenocephalus aceratus]